MKANEMPERIYCESDGLGNIVKVHNIKWPDDEAENIEYTRTDAFIEKAEKWLSLNLKMLMNVLDVEYDTHETDIKDFVDDFRMYMKGEKV